MRGVVAPARFADHIGDTAHRDAAFELDPENLLLWQANRKRLTADSIRDSLLAMSGKLDLAAARLRVLMPVVS